MTTTYDKVRMPAEWEPHDATWIGWPREESDWPGKLDCIPWVYTEIVRHLAASERVEIICHDKTDFEQAKALLERTHAPKDRYRLHILPVNRSWMRDSGPTGVYVDGDLRWVEWLFNAWAKYDNYQLDRKVPELFEKVTGVERIAARKKDSAPFVCEGGGIEVDGQGTLIVTEEWLLSSEQIRNPGLTREDYEELFARYLGTTKTIWLGNGIAGDDTHGHVDDITRFIAPGRVMTVLEEDPSEENYKPLQDNKRRLELAKDARGNQLEIITLPMPAPIVLGEERLPASYANFYIANTTVIVPTFNDPLDRVALEKIAACFPDRKVVGISSTDLILGQGTLHCLSQQQPVKQSRVQLP